MNVYGMDDDQKGIYPLRVSSTFVADRHVCDLRGGIQHYNTTRILSRLAD